MRRLLFSLAMAAAFASSIPPVSAAFPAHDGYVVDAAGTLEPATVDRLASELVDYHKRSTNELVVALVPGLDGLAIEDYGMRLFNTWGLGDAGADNGVLLLVAPLQRVVRIQVGDGLTALLSDQVAQVIINTEVLPRFRDGDLDGGVSAGTLGIRRALGDNVRQSDFPPQPSQAPSPSRRPTGGEESGGWTIGLGIGAVALMSLGGSIYGRTIGMRCPQCAERMERGGWGEGGDTCPSCGHFRTRSRRSTWGSSWGGGDFSSGSSSSSSGGGGGGHSSGGGASGSW